MEENRLRMEIHALRIQNNLQEHEICSLKRMCKFYKDNCELFKNEWFDTQFRYNTYGLTKDLQQTIPYNTKDCGNTANNGKPNVIIV